MCRKIPDTPSKATTEAEKDLEGSVTVMAVITGVESAFLRKHERRIERLKLPF